MTQKVIYKSVIFVALLSVLQFSCTELFYPEVDADVSVLVVDGRITNEEGLHEVRLFRTTPLLDRDTFALEFGAEVILHDDEGNSFPYIQMSAGTYVPFDPVVGVVGNSYWIEITTRDGNKFESTPEVMRPAVEIDNIYGEEEEVIYSLDNIKEGVRFYFDASGMSNESLYVRWEYTESWEWHALNYLPPSQTESIVCFPVERSNVVQIFDARYLNEARINHLASALVLEDDVKLNYEYALNVRLYSISEEAFKFWNSLKGISQSAGGLYDVIPSNLQGNVQPCQENTLVIGYFEVASVNEKSEVFDKTSFDVDFADKDKNCEIIEFWGKNPGRDYHVLRTEVVIVPPPVVVYYSVPRYCIDCSTKFSSEKPSFWPYFFK